MTMWVALLIACRPAALDALRHAGPSPTPVLQVVLTVDDVPYQTAAGVPAVADPMERQRVNEAIVGHLRAAGVPATAFVNCDYLDGGVEALEAWDGFGIGNHTAAHGDLHKLPVEVWEDQVRRCHAMLESLGRTPTTFRYPYLHHGLDSEVRDRGFALLAELGERPAPVTVPTSEWLLAERYDETEDDARRDAIGKLYVEHMIAALEKAGRVARKCRGADVVHITLLHVNHLNADWLDDVLVAFGERDFDVIDLEQGLADPLYAEPDQYVGPGSPSWLGRVDLECDVSWFGRQETVLTARLDR